VESFKATLAEVRDADLVLHVADLSSPHRDRQIAAVEEVLGGMDVDPEQTLQVFNKVDRTDGLEIAADLQVRWPRALLLSAKTGEGLTDLKAEIRRRRGQGFCETVIQVPSGLESITGKVYQNSEVRDVRYDGGAGALYRLRIAPAELERLLALGAVEKTEHMEDWETGN
jgi:GTP-binding protein HflX